LFAEEKRQGILAAAAHWPQLPAPSIAVIAGPSPGYVSEVLNGSDQSDCSRKADRIELPFCKSL